MRRIFVALAVAFIVLGFSGNAYAQSVAFTTVTPDTGTISASGTFDAGMGNTGYVVKVYASGPLGNNPVKSTKVYSITEGQQKGQWLVQFNNFPAGDYNLTANLTYQTGLGQLVTPVKGTDAPNNPYTVK